VTGRLREPIAVATLALVAAWTLAALLSWAALNDGIRLGSPYAIYHEGQIALFGRSVQLIPFIAAIALNAIAGVIGLRWIIMPIWGQRFATPIWSLLAGIVPGYLLIVPVVRIVTLLLPHGIAPAVISVLAVIAGAWAWHGLWRRKKLGPMRWRELWPALAAIAAVLVFQVHFDRFHISGEASLWYYISVYFHDAHGLGTDARLPLIAQHYDEPAFLYPIAFGLIAPGPSADVSIAAIHWLTLGLGRLGMLCLTYLALRGLDLDRLSAIVCVLFVSAASLSLNPASSRLLFDSLSPLGYALHTARILIPVLPLLVLSAAANAGDKVSLRAAPLAFLLGLGVASLPLHAALLFPFALVLLVAAAVNPTAGAALPMWRIACAGGFAIIVAMSSAYGLPDAPAHMRAALLVASALIAAGAMAGFALLRRERAPFSQDALGSVGLVIAAGAGYGLGMALLGNLAIERLMPLLDGYWPWRGLPVEHRFSSYYVAPALQLGSSHFCQTGFEWGFRTLGGHCNGLSFFIRTYGLAFALIAGVIAWILLKGRQMAAGRVNTLILWALALCLFALPITFVLFDFVSSRQTHGFTFWVRSRLLEPWFIGGVLIALVLLFREADARLRRCAQNLMLLAVALLAFNPLVFAGQWIANVAYLAETAFGR
jgi:hypothetical protein